VVVTLALGMGANTAVFSVLRGVMLRPLPHRDGDRLLYLRQSAGNIGQQDIWFSVPEIADIRVGAPSLAAVAEFSSLTFNLIGAGEPAQVQAGVVSGNVPQRDQRGESPSGRPRLSGPSAACAG
jgi:putative ABC transport system permease protein